MDGALETLQSHPLSIDAWVAGCKEPSIPSTAILVRMAPKSCTRYLHLHPSRVVFSKAGLPRSKLHENCLLLHIGKRTSPPFFSVTTLEGQALRHDDQQAMHHLPLHAERPPSSSPRADRGR